jgi:hypothetical protein
MEGVEMSNFDWLDKIAKDRTDGKLRVYADDPYCQIHHEEFGSIAEGLSFENAYFFATFGTLYDR